MSAPLLQVESLSVTYATEAGRVHGLRGASVEVGRGEVFGLVGESGCGKSTLAYAILGDLGETGRREGGRILFKGRDVLSLSEPELRRLRGSEVAIVHQDPAAALTPTMKIGAQLVEILQVHGKGRGAAAEQRCLDLLDRVQLADPRRLMGRYPHQLSGGQQQRVVIAMALLGEPDLLVLDEPTTGLDVTVEAAVLDLLLEIGRELGVTIIHIAHNLGVIARVCERVGVMYAGEFVEIAPASELFRYPRHPYTISLLRCVPRADRPAGRHSLTPIPGSVRSVVEVPIGCSFAERCTWVRPTCREARPELQPGGAGAMVRCLRWREVSSEPEPTTVLRCERTVPGSSAAPQVLAVADLRVHYASRLSRLGPRRQAVKAVDGVDLSVGKARILAIVGESGCGKSSLGAAIVGLRRPTSGRLRFEGADIGKPVERRSQGVRRLLQMIFQDHSATLNPTIPVGRIVGRPLRLFSIVPGRGIEAEARRLLHAVGLDATTMRRKPSQLSGGQRQRVAIARAFASRPKLVVCDEITSALDVSVQASVLNFLLDLQRDSETSLIFISHDLGVVRYLANDVVVMYLGRVCESGPAERVFGGPNHPYTEALLSAVPVPDPGANPRRIHLEGTVPSAVSSPAGCPFHTRCPRRLEGICDKEVPPWRHLEGGHRIWCHLPLAPDELPCPAEQAGEMVARAAASDMGARQRD
jgi:peptide/nickel transport system ATP-binding protein